MPFFFSWWILLSHLFTYIWINNIHLAGLRRRTKEVSGSV